MELLKTLILQGNLAELKELAQTKGITFIKNNADEEELSSLHWASGTEYIEIVKFFLDPPISEDPNLARVNHFFPIHVAAMQGQVEVVKLLVAYGAKVDVQTEPQKYAPIHSAAYAGHLETIKALVGAGANIELQNYRGEMPIDTAKRQNQTEVVQYFKSLETAKNNKLEKVQQGMMALLNQMGTKKQSAENYQLAIQNYLKKCEQKGWIQKGTVSFHVEDENNTGQFNLQLKLTPNTSTNEFVLELKGEESGND